MVKNIQGLTRTCSRCDEIACGRLQWLDVSGSRLAQAGDLNQFPVPVPEHDSESAERPENAQNTSREKQTQKKEIDDGSCHFDSPPSIDYPCSRYFERLQIFACTGGFVKKMWASRATGMECPAARNAYSFTWRAPSEWWNPGRAPRAASCISLHLPALRVPLTAADSPPEGFAFCIGRVSNLEYCVR